MAFSYLTLATLTLTAHLLFQSSGVAATSSPGHRRAAAAYSSTSSTSEPSPSSSSELELIQTRRVSRIVGELQPLDTSQISEWASSLNEEGQWSDVDYTTGCAARRANWPAQEHWVRLVDIAAGLNSRTVKDIVQPALSRGMDWWFAHDFKNPACIDSGGTDACPCSDNETEMWNTNWYSNTIGAPLLIAETCLLVGNSSLTGTQYANCSHILGRSYATIPTMTGANTLDVATIGSDLALLTLNASLLEDAYRRVHNEVVINPVVKGDGIKPDGSFGQHAGLLYNGNYGKDFTNAILNLETQAGGTSFSANETSRFAFETLFDGDSWMIYRNTETGVLHWDFSALPRFISFPVADDQATANIKLNLTEVRELGDQWSSDPLQNFADSLTAGSSSANAGNLTGNRMFPNNDYMVHRGKNYVTSLKMYSTRTKNTECTNSQNPLGFHLADGTLYTYLDGTEYEDISAAWNWNLIPGITVDYNATPLTCDRAEFTGIESFVGGASNNGVGVAAMRYTNPYTRSLSWNKAWFFLDDDIQHVMVNNISSTTDAPVYSVLDQRRHAGAIFFDSDGVDRQDSLGQESLQSGIPRHNVQSLWHGNVGYTFPPQSNQTLSLRVGSRTGKWSTIGISTQPPVTVDLFATWIDHRDATSTEYTVYPGTSAQEFGWKQWTSRIHTLRNDARISAVFDKGHNKVLAVYWGAQGGSLDVQSLLGSFTISADQNVALIYDFKSGDVTVSDPSQSVGTVDVVVGKRYLSFSLPSGGDAGSSATQNIYLEHD